MDKIDRDWREHAELREGVRYTVYLDTLDKPTAGIGHLLTKKERAEYPVGAKISKSLVEAWFLGDSWKARRAAEKQAAEIGVEEDWFIVALISVNFQLGTGWTKDFSSTYPAIVNHDFDKAIGNLRKSKWYRQTPVRVEDLISALERVRQFKDRPLKETRTMQGGAIAGANIIAAQVVEEVKDQVEPISGYSDTLQLLFVILALVGIGLTIYARIDDRKKGYR